MPACAFVHLVDGRTIAEGQFDDYVGWLGAVEIARYQRFVRPERRRQFVIGRVLARKALAELLGADPRELVIEARPGQAPELAGPHHTTSFSISHSGPWVACAVSADSKLGLDIEQVDSTRNIVALAEQAFDAERCAWLAARPQASRVRDFYTLWSTQEARIKLGPHAPVTTELFHPELSIVLCSNIELHPAPQWKLAAL